MGPMCERTLGFVVSCAVWGFHRTGRSSHTQFGDTLMTAKWSTVQPAQEVNVGPLSLPSVHWELLLRRAVVDNAEVEIRHATCMGFQ
jgi:hypothetical protein